MDKVITLQEVGSVGEPKSFKATDLPSGGEPDHYVKNAQYANNVLTLTLKDNTTVVVNIPVVTPELPALPEDAETKTYALQAVNGVLTWVAVAAE